MAITAASSIGDVPAVPESSELQLQIKMVACYAADSRCSRGNSDTSASAACCLLPFAVASHLTQLIFNSQPRLEWLVSAPRAYLPRGSPTPAFFLEPRDGLVLPAHATDAR